MAIGERLMHAWNAFKNKDPTNTQYGAWHSSYGYRPDRPFLTLGNERSIVASIYNRIAIDVAQVEIHHVRTDQNGRYKAIIPSSLEECLTVSANKDQTGRDLIMDAVISLCDEGVIAIVPVDTSLNPAVSNSYEIQSLRVGKIVQWAPDYVQVHLYNDRTGEYEDVWCEKKSTAIVENPLYTVMNQPNSTLKRLIYKLNILDAIDKQSGSGKLDIIIQLPYVVKGELKQRQAEERRKNIEMQLTESKYGIAYIDATEHVTQLNRPAENNLMTQIEYLTNQLYSQLGVDETVFNGTATEQTMLNYYNRTTEPILSAIVGGMKRAFLTKTARTQGQSIMFFRDPFKLMPVSQVAEIADKLTRNEILSSNEMRAIIGYKPVDDPRADQLRNANLNQQDGVTPISTNETGDQNASDESAAVGNIDRGRSYIESLLSGGDQS